MGAGKTVTACAFAAMANLPMVVICPKSVLQNWEKTAKIFGVDVFEIVTYNSLSGTYNHQPKNKLIGRINSEDSNSISYTIKPEFQDLISSGVLVVFDESHKTKNVSNQLFSSLAIVRKIVSNPGNSRILLVSATPGDKVEHIFSLVRMAGIVLSDSLSFYNPGTGVLSMIGLEEAINWCKIANKPLTNQILNDIPFAKKTSMPILFALYSRIISKSITIAMPPPSISSERDAANGFYRLGNSDKIELAILNIKELVENRKEGEKVQLGNILKALHEIEIGKIPTMIRLAKENLEKNPMCKVLLYFNHLDSLETTSAALEKYNPVILQGKMTSKQRDESISTFQRPFTIGDTKASRVFISTVRSGSTGISLDDVTGNHPRFTFLIPDYHFIEQYQASGRTVRLTTKSKSTIRFVYGQGEMLEYELNIMDNLAKKSVVMKEILINEIIAPLPSDYKKYYEQ